MFGQDDFNINQKNVNDILDAFFVVMIWNVGLFKFPYIPGVHLLRKNNQILDITASVLLVWRKNM